MISRRRCRSLLARSGASFVRPTRVRRRSSKVSADSFGSMATPPMQGSSGRTTVVVGRPVAVVMRTWRVGLGVARLVVFIRLSVSVTSAGRPAMRSAIARIRLGRNLCRRIRRSLPSSVAVRLMWLLRVSVCLAPLRQAGRIRVRRALPASAKNLGVRCGTLPSRRRRSPRLRSLQPRL